MVLEKSLHDSSMESNKLIMHGCSENCRLGLWIVENRALVNVWLGGREQEGRARLNINGKEQTKPIKSHGIPI